MSEDDDKPFGCSEVECGMRFTNEDHLNVHMKKHEMCLALSLGGNSGSPGHHFLDQTPTPTKFLKNCEEIGLFQELSKNPFEEAFKKATDLEIPPLPGPLSNDLNTPIPKPLDLHTPIPRLDTIHHRPGKELSNLVYQVKTVEDEALDLSGKKQVTRPTLIQPSSTTTDDEVVLITTSQAADSTLSPSNIIMSPPLSEKSITGTNKIIPTLATTVLSSPVIIQTSSQLLTTSSMATTPPTTVQQPNYTAQVYLQLPSGQMVPVNIPSAAVSPVVQIPILPPQTSVTPTTPIASRPTTTSTHFTLKQRLKQSLQAQQQQKTNGISPNHNSDSPVSATSSTGSTVLIPESVSHSEFTPPDSPDDQDYDNIDVKRMRHDDQQSFEDEDPDNRRRKFLERNRAAAARCRQKRKSWVNSLERKADDLQNVNVKLQGEVSLLRREVAQLKTLLLAHRECPVTLKQKAQGQMPISLTVPTTSSDELNSTGVIQHISLSNDIPTTLTLFPTVITKTETK